MSEPTQEQRDQVFAVINAAMPEREIAAIIQQRDARQVKLEEIERVLGRLSVDCELPEVLARIEELCHEARAYPDLQLRPQKALEAKLTAEQQIDALKAELAAVRAIWPHIEVPNPAFRYWLKEPKAVDPGAPACLRCKIEEAIGGAHVR